MGRYFRCVALWMILLQGVLSADIPRPQPNLESIGKFLLNESYKVWENDGRIRGTGALVNGIDATTHNRVRCYYSPEVMEWLRAGKPADGIPDGAMIIKEMYPTAPKDGDRFTGWAIMLKHRQGSYDGWFWGYFPPPKEADPQVTITGSTGSFGEPVCMACHACADDPEGTFSSLENLEPYGFHQNEVIHFNARRVFDLDWGTDQKNPNKGKSPTRLWKPNEEFLAVFPAPQNPLPWKDFVLPSQSDSAVRTLPTGPRQFLTSDNCMSCHGAPDMVRALVPNMLYQTKDRRVLDFSPFGEWQGSLMALAGRDPVFHAQLESEKTARPHLAEFFDNTCYSCHGVMGQRQLKLDKGERFTHEMIYEVHNDPHALYGALARDGISCTICHHITEEGLGTIGSFTGNFKVGPPDKIYGPYDNPKALPMEQALGITPEKSEVLSKSSLCGSCHTVILPKIPAGRKLDFDPKEEQLDNPAFHKAHEQATYLEWRNSIFQDEVEPINRDMVKSCQDCHMPGMYEPDNKLLKAKIANIQDHTYPSTHGIASSEDLDLEIREPYSRHTLRGINVFVTEMFEQFSSVLGVYKNLPDASPITQQYLQTAQEASFRFARNYTANLIVEDMKRGDKNLEIQLMVENLAGHRLPTGVALRRVFLSVLVMGEQGEVLWGSGRVSPIGVILGPDGEPLPTEFSRTQWQPHYELIQDETEVQIYESRYLNNLDLLSYSFVGIFDEVKDNRMLPKGWTEDGPDAEFTRAVGVNKDPMYTNGAGGDRITYRVPLEKIPGAKTVRICLNYQSVPPSYLKEVFDVGSGPASQRLHALASHLNLEGSGLENWNLVLQDVVIDLEQDLN